jgi:tRNA A-37 threonylcarbamoyl transferase component Bud32
MLQVSLPRPADEAITAVPPSARARALPRLPTPIETRGLDTSVASAEEALEQGAFNRLRVYRVAMLSWCALGLVAATVIPGQVRDRVACFASVAVFMASYVLRDESGSPTERIKKMFPVAVVQAVGAIGVTLGLGLASPFNALVVIALFLYALSAPPAHARAAFVLLAGSYAVLSVLVLAGWIPGTGLLAPAPLPFWTQLANTLWVEGTYATGFAVGVIARRDSARLVAELERVVRSVAHREALLREARDELARVAKVGGRGPFSSVDLGEFHLGDVIGRGGMGEVYAATRLDGSGEAAVKLLRRDVLAQPDMVRRFEREARIVESIRSPHIVAVYDVGGEDAALPYIAMERLYGDDLVSQVRARGALTLGEAVTLVREVCEGLSVAHAAGVIHRDLKPANLFHAQLASGAEYVVPEKRPRCWKILDFGVSKLLQSSDATLTTNQVLGTPHYMSPEQAARRPVDGRTDLYGLGTIVYRVLTGKLAFPKSDVNEVIRAVLDDMPEDPRGLAAMPEDVGLWLRIAMAKKPEERFATAADMAEAFEAAAKGEMPVPIRARARALLLQQAWGARRSSAPPPEGGTRYQ